MTLFNTLGGCPRFQHRRHFARRVGQFDLRRQPVSDRNAVWQDYVGQELALQRRDTGPHGRQLFPDDQLERPPALPAGLLPCRLLSGRRPSGFPRCTGEIVDRWHCQHEVNAPSGNVERHQSAVTIRCVGETGSAVALRARATPRWVLPTPDGINHPSVALTERARLTNSLTSRSSMEAWKAKAIYPRVPCKGRFACLVQAGWQSLRHRCYKNTL